MLENFWREFREMLKKSRKFLEKSAFIDVCINTNETHFKCQSI